MGALVYFSSQTGNTHHLIEKTGIGAHRIPISPKDGALIVDEPFVLVVPTYGASDGRGAIPKQVLSFLETGDHENLIRGVIGGGNMNFGATYCLAARKISEKYRVPVLYKFELRGTSTDADKIRTGMELFWKTRH
ncbi:class Ib ribonucleoside-diphosphate reductase assembly flavoprotein NrdI [Agrobacterium rubi]|nr:class Ib ribonucleoside-diphosphate reductase assembly flavoprotein NrdI [Agrobacterium rubi]NTF24242.1 class Ib ribonucleoside-diphosphate reductase assembly flavoprotein NrdI [Agrobacterium rubi]